MTLAVRQVRTTAEDALAAQFAAREAAAPRDALAVLRAEAFGMVAAQGLPNRRVEEWKYTDLKSAFETAFAPAAAPSGKTLAAARAALARVPAIAGARRLVFVDGFFAAALSELDALEAGLAIAPRSAAQDDFAALLGAERPSGDVAFALNTAFAEEALEITLADGVVVERVLHLIHLGVSDQSAVYTRVALRLGARAHLAMAESVVGAAGARQNNRALRVVIGEGATLDCARLQDESDAALDLNTMLVELGGAARFSAFNLATGAALSRNQIFLRFAGRGAHAALHGAALLTGRQHADTTLFVDHAVPGCTSAEQFRAVLDGASHGVFQGQIVVRPDAQKTEARMMSRALLLSDEAEADNKPELEIYADDVTCSHGAVAGQLDEDLLFYLMARGIPEREARVLLVQAFVGEAIERIEDERLRDAVQSAALHHLGGAA